MTNSLQNSWPANYSSNNLSLWTEICLIIDKYSNLFCGESLQCHDPKKYFCRVKSSTNHSQTTSYDFHFTYWYNVLVRKSQNGIVLFKKVIEKLNLKRWHWHFTSRDGSVVRVSSNARCQGRQTPTSNPPSTSNSHLLTRCLAFRFRFSFPATSHAFCYCACLVYSWPVAGEFIPTIIGLISIAYR